MPLISPLMPVLQFTEVLPYINQRSLQLLIHVAAGQAYISLVQSGV